MAISGRGALVGAAVVDRRRSTRGRSRQRVAIDKLGSFDFAVRTQAARTIRRAPAATAVPALVEAVGHTDAYVRYRALVLLTAFDEKRAAEMVSALMADRERSAADRGLRWFEHHPDPSIVPALVVGAAERAVRVRPSGADPRDCRARQRRRRRARRSAAGDARRGRFPRRGHRGARRLQGATTRCRRSSRSPSSTVRCRKTRSLALGQIGDRRRARRWPRCSDGSA